MKSLPPIIDKRGLKYRIGNQDSAAYDLIEKLMAFQPEKRLNMKEAMEHPFFDEVRNG